MDFSFLTESRCHVSEVVKAIDKNVIRNLLPSRIRWEAFATLPTKRFPAYVYKTKSMAHFGYFVDLLVRCILYQEFPHLCDLSRLSESPELLLFLAISDDSGEQSSRTSGAVGWRKLVPQMVEMTRIPGSPGLPDVMPPTQKDWSLFNKFVTDVRKNFAQMASIPGEKIVFGEEILSDRIQGHPDLPWSNGVLDIKTISKPSTNAEVHFAQAAAYAALRREKGIRTDYIGLYYTLHANPLVTCDIREWDEKPFLNAMRQMATRIQNPETQMAVSILEGSELSKQKQKRVLKLIQSMTNNLQLSASDSPELSWFRSCFAQGLPPGMGHHITGCSQVEAAIMMFQGYPVQFYFTPQTGKFPEYDIPRLRGLLQERRLTPAFIHAPCWMNISNPANKRVSDPIVSLNVFVRELQMGAEMGLSGVVYHSGRNKAELGISDAEALQRMFQYTLWCVIHAKVSCPFLLETPVGYGSEILYKVDDFTAFYKEVVANYSTYFSRLASTRSFTSPGVVQSLKPTPESECPFGICIDTAHIWGAGHGMQEYFDAYTRVLSPKTIKLVHFNDSIQQKGSRRDGHAVPGTGNIPLVDLLWVYNFCRQHNIPMVRE